MESGTGAGTRRRPLVLIVCRGNSCRSQMAEAFLRLAAGDLLEVASAGSDPSGYVHPLAIRVMAEIGIDISAQSSKHINQFLRRDVETVITVCAAAEKSCPVFPRPVNRHHWPFDDPSEATGTERAMLQHFRRVRDEIRRVFEAYAAGRRDQTQWQLT
ncbi:MAG: arsenate reductase ArsC [Verrucomicrobiae bacterium]|nr:arsenate reductase ArsC [Verrucomicrobiae bacterium]